MKKTIFHLLGATLTTVFDGKGAQETAQRVHHIQTQAQDFSPAFKLIDALMMSGVQKSFSQGGHPVRWHPLAEATQKQRVAQGYGGASPILVRSGTLKRGFRSKIGKHGYTIYNRVPYFPYQQFGTSTIPARPMVVVRANERNKIAGLLRAHLGID